MKPEQFECALEEKRCKEAFERINEAMLERVVDFDISNLSETSFFDLPSSLRTLLGLSDFVNQVASRYMLYHRLVFDHSAKNLAVFLNCLPKHTEEILASPVPADVFEISGM